MDGTSPPGGPLPEADFSLDGGGAGFSVRTAYVTEGLADLYECHLGLNTATAPTQPGNMLLQPVVFTMNRDSHARRVCGIIRSVEDTGHDGVQYHLNVTVVPALFLLSQRSDYKIWQDLTAVEIVKDVLKTANLYQGSTALKEDLSPDPYPKREYCTQFGETDLEFVKRLLQEEGITFYFTHDHDTETLVLADGSTPTVWSEVPTMDDVSINLAGGQGGALASTETIYQFHTVHDLQPTGVTFRDYNFTAPDATADMTRSNPPAPGTRVLYEYPGHYSLGDYDAGGTHAYRKHDGRRRVRARQEGILVNELVCFGLSNVTGMQPGATFTLAGHDRNELDAKYLVISVEHHGHAPDASMGGHEAAGDRYSNNFRAIKASTVFRPALAPRPKVSGPQTAKVMARPHTTEEISVDVHGRVLVQFNWDRPENRNVQQKAMQSSVWVRVAQSWAGAQFGAIFIPRVNMEVLVTFVDGDPDRPLITGCIYNGQHMPPHTLPEENTKTTIKTNSTPGGHGYNELTFKDQAGSEKVYLRAQKDHQVQVLHDEVVTVGRDQQTSVVRDRTVTVDHNETVLIKNDQHTTVQHHGFTQANDSLTYQVGQSKIEIFPDRIVLTSPSIEIKGTNHVDIKGGMVDINS